MSIRKIYPTADECQTSSNTEVTCTFEGCSTVFKSEPHLTLHLVKCHKQNLWESGIVKQYYCPEVSCIYHKRKYLKNLKLLKQHYGKVHSIRNHNCTNCQQTFPSEIVLKNHVMYCGISFKCCECDAFYARYETLQTHARRKKHTILHKTEYKNPTLEGFLGKGVCFKYIQPKPQPIVQYVVVPGLQAESTDQCVQTDEEENPKRNKSKHTQQTQTGSKNQQFTVQTQTIGDFSNMTSSKTVLDVLLENRSIKTQTNQVCSRTQSSNTSFNLEDFEFNFSGDIETNSLGTQTNTNPSLITHDSIHTDTTDLLDDPLADNFDTAFFNCHIETQTDFMLQDYLFNPDYLFNCSDMCTQTCEEILNGLGITHNQTQTNLDEMLKSVESQTIMSHNTKTVTSPKSVTNMETQTDNAFNKILEEINS